MKYRLLGRSGLRVSELFLGTMTLGEERGSMGNTQEEYRKISDSFMGTGALGQSPLFRVDGPFSPGKND